ncbi:MAG: amidohydrolase [Pedosphaera sp.]|nr:amidohydrolase [Pedosphaera sp.]
MPRSSYKSFIFCPIALLAHSKCLAAFAVGLHLLRGVLLAQQVGLAAGAEATGVPASRGDPSAALHVQQQGLDRLHRAIDEAAARVMPKVIAYRRDFHQHPELSNQEVRTAKIVADELRRLGIEVRTGVAHTGVVGVLRGGNPGGVVALRADMDALPVTEEGDLPFKSTIRTHYNGHEVGVMHACGHDAHTAMLLGAAEVLTAMKAELPGAVVFLFQPAEEGLPDGEVCGAELMMKEGALDHPKVDAIFGLHVFHFESGEIRFRPGGFMAGYNDFKIRVQGHQTHGAMPWDGVDPIVVASQIVLGLQTIISRQIKLTTAPAIITIGSIQGGTRNNIIPNEVMMEGTIRTFDPEMRKQIHKRVNLTATSIAQSAGATADVKIENDAPITFNDLNLTAKVTGSLRRVSVGRCDSNTPAVTISEDFSFYQQRVPGLFFFLGVTPKGTDPSTVAPNHSPKFFVDEGALITGVRAMASLAVDYLAGADDKLHAGSK